MAMTLRQIHALAHAAGAQATHIARVAIYGTRRFPSTNAGTAPNQQSAIGKGLHSVWQGPKQIRSGAPVLKRDRQGSGG